MKIKPFYFLILLKCNASNRLYSCYAINITIKPNKDFSKENGVCFSSNLNCLIMTLNTQSLFLFHSVRTCNINISFG